MNSGEEQNDASNIATNASQIGPLTHHGFTNKQTQESMHRHEVLTIEQHRHNNVHEDHANEEHV
jgi:hypothetical protein